jgi:hypothetical protein
MEFGQNMQFNAQGQNQQNLLVGVVNGSILTLKGFTVNF